LRRNNEETSAWIFGGEVFDPADAVTIFKERIDQQNIGVMFSDQFARIVKTVCAAANMISFIAPDDGSHPLFADARVPHHHDPTQHK
jgi:hypothetical protein